MAAFPAFSICWRLRCSGPSISQLRVLSMLRVTWLTRSGKPMTNWLMTNVMMPPRIAKPVNSTRATAPPRGAPRRSSQSTAWTSNALNISASSTGTTMISSRAITHNSAITAAKMANNRQDQAAVFRTMGSTDSSAAFDGIIVKPNRRTVCHRANTVRTPVPGSDPGATRAATLNYVSRDAPATNVDGHDEERARGKYWWVRWAVLGVVAIVLAVEVAL